MEHSSFGCWLAEKLLAVLRSAGVKSFRASKRNL